MGSRNTITIQYSDFHKMFSHPEKLLIKFDDDVLKFPLDFGCCCYSIRSENPTLVNRAEDRIRTVEVKSLRVERRKIINKFINDLYIKSFTHTTLYGYTKLVLKTFDWLDSNGYSDFSLNEENMQNAYIAFTGYLFAKIYRGEWGPSVTSQYQKSFISIMRCTFPKNYLQIVASAPIIKDQKNPVAAPSKGAIDSYLSVVVPFVRNLRQEVMNKPFPIKVNCGEYDVHLMPVNHGAVDSPFAQPNRNWNSTKKRFLTLDEYQDAKLGVIENYERIIKTRANHTNTVNSYYNTKWAQSVVAGYAKLLGFVLGGYPSELLSLNDKNAYEVINDQSKKELSTIKFRAKGAEIKYVVNRRGIILLKEYMEFRKWYLDGRNTSLIFFNLLEAHTLKKLKNPTRLSSGYDTTLFKKLSGVIIDPNIKNITPRQSRKFKSYILKHLGYSVDLTAEALQHSTDTNLTSYSTVGEETVASELGDFWAAVRSNAIDIEYVAPGVKGDSKDITVGHCDNYGFPNLRIASAPIEPNCRKPYGCLFCDKYLVHADERDIHKLYSLRYVLDLLREHIKEVEVADKLFRELSVRAGFIIKEMIVRYPHIENIAKEVNKKVFQLGILTPFWEERLGRYEELGVII